MFIQIALFIASLIISAALQPKSPKPKAAAFEEFDFPTVDDGTPITVVFGDVWIKDWTVLGVANYRTEAIVAKIKGLFGSKKTTTGYRYFMSIHMGLCLGMDTIIEIRVGDRVLWPPSAIHNNPISDLLDNDYLADVIKQGELFGGDKGEGGIDGAITFYKPGHDWKDPLEAVYGEETPLYNSVASVLYDGMVCSNSPYPKPWAFRLQRVTQGWNDAVWYAGKAVIWLENNTIKAMNPAHIIYEAQTNHDWGRGFSSSQLDLVSYQLAADQLFSEGFGLCLAWKRQDTLNEFIQQILNHIGAAHFIDRTTGLWKLTLIRDSYSANDLQIFDSTSGLLEIIEDNNSASDVAANQVVVAYRDPVSNEERTIRAENLASIQAYGVISETKNYAGLPTANLAGRVAARDLKIGNSGLKKFKVVLDRRAYLLQPASVFRIAALEQGIENLVVRAIRVEHDTATNGKITVTAIQDVFGLPSTNYINQQPSMWQPPSITALPVSVQKLYEVPYADLLNEFSLVQIQAMSGKGYVGVVAAQPASLHLDFDILAKTTVEPAYQNIGTGDFGFIAPIAAPILQSATPTTCALLKPISANVQVGDRAFLDGEIVRIDNIDRSTNTLVLARGCLDTVPAAHSSDAMLWVYTNTASVAEREFLVNQTANVKLITRTSRAALDPALALGASITINNRLARPYPPSNVKINNSFYPAQITGDLALTWLHRDRLQNSESSFTDHTSTAEPDTTYNLRVYDANNMILHNKIGIDALSYTWGVPRIFDGEIVTVLDIPMTGANNSTDFTDISSNAFTVNNDGVLIKTDVDATGGSSALFDFPELKTNAHVGLNLTNKDHCVEGRWKTPTGAMDTDQLLVGFRFLTTGPSLSNGNIPDGYSFAITYYMGVLTVGMQGPHGNPPIDVSYSHQVNLPEDTYFDWAIEKIGNIASIYIDGSLIGTGAFNIRSDDDPRYLTITARNSDLSFMANGLRITKKTGGRYAANYTPQQFTIGVSDPHWSNVELLIPMTASNGLIDVAANNIGVIATQAVVIKTDAQAYSGSAIRFCQPKLSVPYNAMLNLRDKSFIIEGKTRISSFYSDLVFFDFKGSMSLRWSVVDLAIVLQNAGDDKIYMTAYTLGEYCSWRIERDAATGIAKIFVDGQLVNSGLFNPLATSSGDIELGNFRTAASFNGFRVQTVDGAAGTMPNVANPLRIELESQRDGLFSFQAYTSQVTVE